MRVRRLPFQGTYRILAACDTRGDCALLDFLDDLGGGLEKDGDRMLAVLEKVAQQGPLQNNKVSHKIDGDIWEFIQGRLRVLYFYDEGRVVVCTHGFVKKTQKAPKGEIATANRVREQYLAAKRQGSLFIEEE